MTWLDGGRVQAVAVVGYRHDDGRAVGGDPGADGPCAGVFDGVVPGAEHEPVAALLSGKSELQPLVRAAHGDLQSLTGGDHGGLSCPEERLAGRGQMVELARHGGTSRARCHHGEKQCESAGPCTGPHADPERVAGRPGFRATRWCGTGSYRGASPPVTLTRPCPVRPSPVRTMVRRHCWHLAHRAVDRMPGRSPQLQCPGHQPARDSVANLPALNPIKRHSFSVI